MGRDGDVAGSTAASGKLDTARFVDVWGRRMRLVELSDHPASMLRHAQQERRGGAHRAQAEYAAARTRHAASLDQARAERDEARAQHRWLRWIRAVFTVWAGQRRAPRMPVPAGAATDREESIAAGIAGEQRVALELGQVLGDDWVLFHGYRNRRGEIDHLLLGPRGLFAIEVKHRNATVYIAGDEWRYKKFDQWGNQVESGSIEDRTGRSPSLQVNESATELERFLGTRGQSVAITRIVILNHPRSKIGSYRGLTVRVGTSTDYILSLVDDSSAELPAARRAELERLIERDHQFHAARRPRR